MTFIKEVIDQGVKEGFAIALADVCDGQENPDERCPLKPEDGCACYFAVYQKAPWYRRIFMDKPVIPSPQISTQMRVRILMNKEEP